MCRLFVTSNYYLIRLSITSMCIHFINLDFCFILMTSNNGVFLPILTDLRLSDSMTLFDWIVEDMIQNNRLWVLKTELALWQLSIYESWCQETLPLYINQWTAEKNAFLEGFKHLSTSVLPLFDKVALK